MSSPAGAKVVSCPECGASITLRALGQSVIVACAHCRTQLDVSRPDIRIIQAYREQAAKLILPLGTRGDLKGQKYEVVGAMQRVVSGYRWQEYLLFNPYVGFRWLVYDSGHWNFGEMIKDTSKIIIREVLLYESRFYRKFQESKPKVEWVIGEFYWRVAVGDEVKSSDYIAPPLMLSLEKAEGEFTWTLLEYLEPEKIEAAFGISVSQPRTVAPNQPNPVAQSLQSIKGMIVLALVAAVTFQAVTMFRSQARRISVGAYELAPGNPEQQVFGPLTFDAPRSLNELNTFATINNSWIELNCSLVDAKTGVSRDFTNAFSFYSGNDSDGAWTEGETHDTSLIADVPAGTYNLVIEGASGDEHGARLAQPVSLELRHDVVPWRNFWLAILAILAYPALLLWRRMGFEKARWAESDFGPDADEE